MTATCPLELTQAEFDQIRQCEAVVVREYERPDGSRYARAAAWGDADEMAAQAATPSIVIIPVGVSFVCQRAVPTAELLAAT